MIGRVDESRFHIEECVMDAHWFLDWIKRGADPRAGTFGLLYFLLALLFSYR